MNTDDFEPRLQRQPLRAIPTEWRGDILSAAEHVAASHHSPLTTRHSFFSILNVQLSTILWPCPKAWAGLAAIWLMILALNVATGEKQTAVAKRMPPPSPEMLMVLQAQGKIMAELLMERSEPLEAEQPKPAKPRPHGERRQSTIMV